MTSAREIKRLVQPLLRKNIDLVLATGRLVLLKPLHHIMRGIFIDRTSSKNQFEPFWVTVHLFEYRKGISVNMGQTIFRGRGYRWQLDEPGIDLELDRKSEEQALPRLRSIQTITDYIQIATGPDMFQKPLADPGALMVAHVATGNLDAARAIGNEERWKWPHVTDPYMRPLFDRWERMAGLVIADDRQAMIALLHEWEEQTVANMQLTEFWERTPFPIEEMA